MSKKLKVRSIHFNKDRKSVTIKFNKKYSKLGIGAAQLALYLLKFHVPK